MDIKSLKIIGLFLILMSFQAYGFEYDELADSIGLKTARKIEQEYQLKLVGTGGGMIDYVNRISLDFINYNPMTREEARRLLIKCAKKLWIDLNSCKKLRPFLKDYPFKIENVEIAIVSYSPNDLSYYDPYIAGVIHGEGKIIYYMEDENDKNAYKSQYKETIEEALTIVEKELYLPRPN